MRQLHAFLTMTALVAGFAGGFGAALAQDKFPIQPVELINSASPGGGSDIFLRMLSSVSQEFLGGDFVVLSKTGGGSIVAMNYVNNRKRDGYTLQIFTPGQLLTLAQGKAPFTYDDIVPLVVGNVDPIVLVSKAKRFAGVKAMIEEGKKRPLKAGGTQAGNYEWMAAVAFARDAGLTKPIYLPLKGGGEVLINTIGGNLDFGVANLTEVTDQVRAGELDALVVMDDKRSAALPNVPTAKELGINLSLAQARGLIALKGVPEDRIAKLEGAFLKGMATEKYQSYLKSSGLGQDSIGGREKWGAMMAEISKTVVKTMAEFNPAK